MAIVVISDMCKVQFEDPSTHKAKILKNILKRWFMKNDVRISIPLPFQGCAFRKTDIYDFIYAIF